jgi:hypothetical protein
MLPSMLNPTLPAAAILLLAAAIVPAQTPVATPDITGVKFERPTAGDDYVKREVMIPMRDGVKLFTSIVIPKGARSAPVILTRTPYNAAGRTTRNRSARMLGTPLRAMRCSWPGHRSSRMCEANTGRKGVPDDAASAGPNPTPVDRRPASTPSSGWLRTCPSRTAGSACWAAPTKASPW